MHALDDALICESIARIGGYEEIDTNGRWEQVASSLGLAKKEGVRVKERYEDLLKLTAEQEEEEEEDADQDFEVEEIQDERTDKDGKRLYKVKWKDDDTTTWEPRNHLEGASELLLAFEERKARERAQSSLEAPTAAVAPAVGGKRKTSDLLADDQQGSSVASRPASEQWSEVVGIKRLGLTERSFIVVCAGGERVEVTNQQLRSEAPVLLLDFYEARLTFK
mmetsp:Transcript_14245/g.32527  ORF Transcript_14245/g.32527 Transcript_14245/m.32527 type:complete len:222 (-) Transcript_14245:523-1188(-)